MGSKNEGFLNIDQANLSPLSVNKMNYLSYLSYPCYSEIIVRRVMGCDGARASSCLSSGGE